MSNKPPARKVSAVPGLAIISLMLTGVAGWVHAFCFGSALGLIAAAIAFGVLFVVSFR